METADIENRFKFHEPPTEQRKAEHEGVRAECGGLAQWLNTVLPEGREKSLAITHLEEVMMWSNAALARQP